MSAQLATRFRGLWSGTSKAELRSAICAERGNAIPACCRTHEDEKATPLLAQMGEEGTRSVDRTEQVGGRLLQIVVCTASILAPMIRDKQDS
jgi:hypothetical protein